jgi:hypothetical protein
MDKFRQLLQGKKTYLSALLLALAACTGWWFNVLGDTQLIEALGVAGAIAGLGAKSQRNAESVLGALEDLRQAQERRAAGQQIDAIQLARQVAAHIGPQFVSGMGNAISVQSGPLSLSYCIYCGKTVGSLQEFCTDPRNTATPDTAGNRHHVVSIRMQERR